MKQHCVTQTPTQNPTSLHTLLDQAIQSVHQAGTDLSPFVDQIVGLQDRLMSGRFHLAVLGQFKRGKSTLLNALLGQEVLPTAVVPLTAIPTLVQYGPEVTLEVYFQDGQAPKHYRLSDIDTLRTHLADYVTEKGNPQNRRNVDYVQLSLPAGLLQSGVVLIDTPGIGSTYRHNTEATLRFLPQCDAALFLLSVDPPITEVEVDFLHRVEAEVPRIFYVLNKVDHLDERERAESLRFLESVLHVQHDQEEPTRIFPVSAKQALQARVNGDDLMWEQSGLASVERHLVDFLADGKKQALADAVARKAGNVLIEALMRLQMEKQSLEMPLEDLQRTLSAFETDIEQVRRQRLVAEDLLAGDRKRSLELLEEHAERLRDAARKFLTGLIQEVSAQHQETAACEQAIHAALDAAVPDWFDHHTAELTELFQRHIAECLTLHQQSADTLVETIRRRAAELFDIPYQAPEADRVFEMVREPYWISRQWSSSLSVLPTGLLERLLTERQRRRRLLRQLDEQVETLVRTNVEQVRWAIYQSINEAFRRFGAELDERLELVLAGTHGAIQAALEERSRRSDTVIERVQMLATVIAKLETIRNDLERLTA